MYVFSEHLFRDLGPPTPVKPGEGYKEIREYFRFLLGRKMRIVHSLEQRCRHLRIRRLRGRLSTGCCIEINLVVLGSLGFEYAVAEQRLMDLRELAEKHEFLKYDHVRPIDTEPQSYFLQGFLAYQAINCKPMHTGDQFMNALRRRHPQGLKVLISFA